MKNKQIQIPLHVVKRIKDKNGLNVFAREGINILYRAGWTYKELSDNYGLPISIIKDEYIHNGKKKRANT
jgi:hypothetical protein